MLAGQQLTLVEDEFRQRIVHPVNRMARSPRHSDEQGNSLRQSAVEGETGVILTSKARKNPCIFLPKRDTADDQSASPPRAQEKPRLRSNPFGGRKYC
jgi:hypothetical protein